MYYNDICAKIADYIEKNTARGAWNNGVKLYALELLEELDTAIKDGYFAVEDLNAPKLLDRQMLNGAEDWTQYSYGGCSLIYDGDIAERLCNPSELKKTHNGERNPNGRETWLDVQARALYQAARRVRYAVRMVTDKC